MSIECWWPEDRQAVRQRDLHLRKHQLAPVVTRMRVSTNFDSGQSLKCNVRIGSAVDLLGRTLMSTLARGVANKVGCRSMRDSRAKRLDVVPSAEGIMTRLAFASAGLVRQGRGQLILEIDIRQLLPCTVAQDKASVVEFFNRPGWREVTRGGGHVLSYRKAREHASLLCLIRWRK